MVPDFPRIQAASVDGRLHNVYHRQVQVEKLCKALTDNFQEIKATIATDYGYSAAEIAVEYHLALNEVKRVYSTLEPKECHDEEYRIFNDKDAPEARKPAGIVYIEPTQHNLFYSTVVPLSAALFAGNCVIVLVRKSSNVLTDIADHDDSLRITFERSQVFCVKSCHQHSMQMSSLSHHHQSQIAHFSPKPFAFSKMAFLTSHEATSCLSIQIALSWQLSTVQRMFS